jgi:hypothetical protein
LKERLKLTEVWFKLVLFLFFGLFFLLAIPYPAKSKHFPQLLAAFSLILIVISLLKDFLQKGKTAGAIADVDDTELRVLDHATQKTRKKRFYKAWGIILVSTGIGFWGGFLFTTFLLLLGFPLLFGQRRKLFKNTVVALGMTIIILFIFQWIFEIPLLEGFIW